MKNALRTFVFLVFSSVLATAATSDYGEWLKTFFKTDDVGKFDACWKAILDEKILETDSAVPPTIGFFSKVLSRHPELLTARFENLERFSGKTQKAVISILWLSDTEQARKILEANGHSKMAKKRPPTIRERKVDQAGDLDYCWGYFFASGEVEALDVIISALDNSKYAGALDRYKASKKTDEDKAAAVKDAIFNAAMWSLSANGKEFPEVLAHLEKALSDKATPDDRRVWIAVILNKLKPGKYRVERSDGGRSRVVVAAEPAAALAANAAPGWRDQQGRRLEPTGSRNSVAGFGAFVLPTKDPEWKQKWNSPPEVTPHISMANSIYVGEQLDMLVFFASPSADKNGEVDVTYDLCIRRPNGQITTQKGLKGAKGKLKGQLTNTFLVETWITFIGEQSDPLGEWEFEISVHDGVRGVSVPLKTKVTLMVAGHSAAGAQSTP